MKKYLLGMLLLSTTFSFAQTRKVLIEEITGLKCPTCPLGTFIGDSIYRNNKANAVFIAYHGTLYEPSNSSLRSADGDSLISEVAAWGAPLGMADRFSFEANDSVTLEIPDEWHNMFTKRRAESAIASIGLANKQYNSNTKEYSTDVIVEFTKLPKAGVPIKIQVQVLEDSIPAVGDLEQSNTIQWLGTYPVIKPYWHNHTFRKSLIGPDIWGDGNTIPATPQLNKKYVYGLKFKLDSKWDEKHVHLVAFIAYADEKDREVINAEEVLNINKVFHPVGISQQQEQLLNFGIYPNPATTQSVVKVQYLLTESSKVSMNVYDMSGRFIQTAYKSNYETIGSHVINWSTNEISSGTYILEIVTSKEKQNKQIVIK